MALTTAQAEAIEAAYQDSLTSTDPNAPAEYYTALAPYFSYGELALGVIENNTLKGITANNYAENKIDHDFGGDFDTQRSSLLHDLMIADHRARAVLDGDGNVIDFNDITAQSISNYHDLTFAADFSRDSERARSMDSVRHYPRV